MRLKERANFERRFRPLRRQRRFRPLADGQARCGEARSSRVRHGYFGQCGPRKTPTFLRRSFRQRTQILLALL